MTRQGPADQGHPGGVPYLAQLSSISWGRLVSYQLCCRISRTAIALSPPLIPILYSLCRENCTVDVVSAFRVILILPCWIICCWFHCLNLRRCILMQLSQSLLSFCAPDHWVQLKGVTQRPKHWPK
ncbi:hypothetical protein IF2G_11021 [Cordyceps javanica]|nr:hypothetical protein IF2G_11021 [Cordyceps javanica]